MNEDEKRDIEILKANILIAKVNCFDYLNLLARASERELETSGYRGKTNAEAVLMAYLTSRKRIDKLTDDFLKKYPDEK